MTIRDRMVLIAVPNQPIPLVGSLLFYVLAAIHVAWALGITWPAPSPERLAVYIAGTPTLPSSSYLATLAVGIAACGLLLACSANLEKRFMWFMAIPVGIPWFLFALSMLLTLGASPEEVGVTKEFLRLAQRALSPLALVLSLICFYTAYTSFKKRRAAQA